MAQERKKRRFALKFWQKTYLLTLALFLLALYGGIAAIASAAQQRAFEAQCGMLLERQHAAAQSLAADAAAVYARRPEALPRLAESYAAQAGGAGMFLRVAHGGELWADTLPAPDTALPEIPPEGQRVHAVLTAGQRHMLYVSAFLPAPPEDVSVTCAFDMEDFFAEWEQTRSVFYTAAAAVSAVLAVALYVVLRGLSRPMERLAAVAGRLADGDYTARSPLRGTDEVGQLAHALNEMAERVEQNVSELQETAYRKQQLVDNVAHELRTPLTAVGGYAQYLQRAELSDEEKYEATQYIVDETERLSAMSRRLLQMAALRGETAAREPVEVPALLGRVVRTVAPKADSRGVLLCMEQTPGYIVYGEAPLLESLLVNLTDNAVKACEAGDSVTLSARAGEACVILRVQDTGCGMDEQTLARLGDPFFRPDKARSRKQGGAGLGLALCRQIAESHGAHIEYASERGVGTIAEVSFPIGEGSLAGVR